MRDCALLLILTASPAFAGFEDQVRNASLEVRETLAQKKANAPAQLRYPERCVLQAVAQSMGVQLRDDVPVPPVYYESKIPLRQFQDAVEPQWQMRPDVFVNAYIPAKNEVYLTDDSSYYTRLSRALDDSLAHEYAHYIQVKYKGTRLEDFGDAEEGQAIEHQTAFRENYIHKAPPEGFCPNR
ncbi:MAG: hypothetical protein WC728_08790 [Elusimicrobiota bacterium]